MEERGQLPGMGVTPFTVLKVLCNRCLCAKSFACSLCVYVCVIFCVFVCACMYVCVCV